MAKFADLTVELQLQSEAFQRGMDTAAKAMDRAAAKARQTQNSMGTLDRGMASLVNTAKAVGAAFGAIKGVEAIVKAADQIKGLQGSFTALLGDAGRAGNMMSRLFEVVEKTGSPIDKTAEAFTRLTVALKPLDASNAQIAQIAENFIKIGLVGRASSEDISSALIQLAQGLASGKLAGDELKSILERVPIAAQVMAESMGVSFGKLKQMGEDGELTADKVANAFLQATAKIDAAFAGLPITFEQATNKMKAAATNFFAEFDAAAGISKTLAIVVEYIANMFKRWHSELVVDQESLSQMQTLAEGVLIIVTAVAKAFVYLSAGIEVSVKFLAHLVQLAQALIDMNWQKAEDSFMRFADNLDAIARNAEKAIAALNGKVEPKQEAYGPPVPLGLLRSGAGTGGGGKAKTGKTEAEREAEALEKQGRALAAMLDPLNAFNQKMAELKKLQDAGAIGSVTYAKAIEKYKEELTATGDALKASIDPGYAYIMTMREIDKAYRDSQIEVEHWVALQEKAIETMRAAEKEAKKKTPLGKLVDDIEHAIDSDISQFFDDIASGSLTAEQAFSKMVQSMIKDIAKLLAELLAKQAVAFVIKSIFGGGVTPTSGSGSLFSVAPQGMSFNAARSLGLEPVALAGTETGAEGAGLDAFGESGDTRWKVVVNNYAPVDVMTRERADGGLEVTIEKVRSALTSDVVRGGNQFARALEGTFKLGRGR